jgi:hypothetical protein
VQSDDAYSDLGGGTAQAPPTAPLPRDRYGKIDKSAPDDEDYPADWTPEQRVKASWAKLQAYRDQEERDDALRYPGTLLTAPPASDETRAKALQDFQLSFGGLDDDEPDEALLHVNPLLVRCPFCKASVGEHCTVSGMPGRPRDNLAAISGHPSRIEAAAVAAGYGAADSPAVVAIVAAAAKRSVKRQRAKWSEELATPKPIPMPEPEPEGGP